MRECESYGIYLHMVGYYRDEVKTKSYQMSEVWIRSSMPGLTCVSASWDMAHKIKLTYVEMLQNNKVNLCQQNL